MVHFKCECTCSPTCLLKWWFRLTYILQKIFCHYTYFKTRIVCCIENLIDNKSEHCTIIWRYYQTMVLVIHSTAGRISPEFLSLNWFFVSLNVVGNFQLQTNFFCVSNPINFKGIACCWKLLNAIYFFFCNIFVRHTRKNLFLFWRLWKNLILIQSWFLPI